MTRVGVRRDAGAAVAVAVSVAIAVCVRTLFAGNPVSQPERLTTSSRQSCQSSLVANRLPRAALRQGLGGPHSDDKSLVLLAATSPGIEYKVPGNTKATTFAHALSGFDADVMFAVGRGRLDIVANPVGPELVAKGLSVAPPLGSAGDYYLFDSTAFILVRPSQRRFSAFIIADHEFNYEQRRNGWPPEFTFIPAGSLKIDTLGSARNEGSVVRHARTRIYWILKMGRAGADLPTNAFGRLVITDAPPGEGGVARWIGPTEVLADMARRGVLVDERKVELMSYLPLSPANGGSIDLGVRQSIVCLRATDIDLAKLTLPRDYKEAAWPGFESETALPRLTERAVAKWRAVPRVN